MKPIVLDLCCGLGGWSAGFIAEGWCAVGVDYAPFGKWYPGLFIHENLLCWEEWRKLPISAVVASPPCEEFSRHSMPWTRKRNPPPPDKALWERCVFIAKELGVPLTLENVRAAQPFMGRSIANCGPYHLWGDVPAIVPVFVGKKKESYGSVDRAKRARIPVELARWVGRYQMARIK